MNRTDKTTQAIEELGYDTTTPEQYQGVTTRGPNRKTRRRMMAQFKKARKQNRKGQIGDIDVG